MKIKICIFLTVLLIFTSLKSSLADPDDFTVNVPNDQGGYTAMIIKKSGDGYIGPQGEYYTSFPSVYQLQTVYKLGTPSPSPVVTYVQPQPDVQPTVTTPVTYQYPVAQYQNYQYYQNDQDDEDQRFQPVVQQNPPPEFESNDREENSGITFFEFKKKKKPQQSQSNNQNNQHSQHPQAAQSGNIPPNKNVNPNVKTNTDKNKSQKTNGNGDPNDKTVKA